MTMAAIISRAEIDRLHESPIESVAGSLGIAVRRHAALCPFHDDARPSLVFSVRSNSYRCYACGAHGDVIDLVMRMRGIGFADACRWLGGGRIADSRQGMCADRRHDACVGRRGSLDRQHDGAQERDLRVLQSMVSHPVISDEAARFLYDERRIRPEVVRWAGLSSIASGQTAAFFNAPALLIPYRDVHGRLLTVQARYLGSGADRPRFQFPRGSRCRIYGMEMLRLLDDGEPLFITEGVTDCLAVMSSGRKAVAIPSATLLNPAELMPLSGLNLHICPDRDEAGERLYLQLRDALARLDTPLVRHRLPDGCKDFAQWWSGHSRAA